MVAQAVRTHGPFDGIIGFSQGASLAALISLQTAIETIRKNKVTSDLHIPVHTTSEIPPFPTELLNFKFGIFFSGFCSHSSRHGHIYKVSKYLMHSLFAH